jgi:hypothetical protein
MHSPAIIHTGKDGAFVSDDARKAAEDIFSAECKSAQRIVVYFHGGLDNAATGHEIARKLDPVFRSADALPVFFVWESGLFEIVSHNLKEIAGEDFFNAVLKTVLKFAYAKVSQAPGAKAAPGMLALPSNMTIERELAKRKTGGEPFSEQVTLTEEATPVTHEEEAALRESLARDSKFIESVDAIYASALPESRVEGAKGIPVRVVTSERTLLSPDVIDALKRDKDASAARQAKGIISSGLLLAKAAKVFVRVVKRFKDRRAHGIYPTVVEEILREFYLANIGAKIWRAMKTETRDTFQHADPIRGGSFFVERLIETLAERARLNLDQPQITLIGHSTGAVFINNLLENVQAQKNLGRIPQNFAFANVILLAPAATFGDFAEYVKEPFLDKSTGLYTSVRIFGMCDQAEQQDVLVPLLYPRSLLYFVSGVLETDTDGSSLVDWPIIGMQRFYQDATTYSDGNVADVRTFVGDLDGRVVWSPCQGGAGLSAGARHHGGFADDPLVRESLLHMIRGGADAPRTPIYV